MDICREQGAWPGAGAEWDGLKTEQINNKPIAGLLSTAGGFGPTVGAGTQLGIG